MSEVLSIIIPAYNEERTLNALLTKVVALDIAPWVKEIVVVNDGSTDKTEATARTFGKQVILLSHEKNRGKGAAVRTGFARATGDYVVVQDADLEYEPEDLKTMLLAALAQNAPVVYGSRNLPHEGKRPQHGGLAYYLGGLMLSVFTNVLYSTRITDEPTCYKMVRRDALERLQLVSNGFEFCPEITAKIARQHIPIIEVPIRYYPRTHLQGKKIRPRDGIIALWVLLKNRF